MSHPPLPAKKDRSTAGDESSLLGFLMTGLTDDERNAMASSLQRAADQEYSDHTADGGARPRSGPRRSPRLPRRRLTPDGRAGGDD